MFGFEILKDINALGKKYDCDVYLVGKSLRNLLLKIKCDNLELLVLSKNKAKKFKFLSLIESLKLPITYKKNTRISTWKEEFTIDTLRLKIDDFLEGNIVLSDKKFSYGQKDFYNSSIRLTKYGEENISTNPLILLKMIILASQSNFIIDTDIQMKIINKEISLERLDKKILVDVLKMIHYHKNKLGFINLLNQYNISQTLTGDILYYKPDRKWRKRNDIIFVTAMLYNCDLYNVEEFHHNKKEINIIKKLIDYAIMFKDKKKITYENIDEMITETNLSKLHIRIFFLAINRNDICRKIRNYNLGHRYSISRDFISIMMGVDKNENIIELIKNKIRREIFNTSKLFSKTNIMEFVKKIKQGEIKWDL